MSSVDFSIHLFSNNGVSDGRIEVEVRNTGINYQAFLGSTMIEEKVVIMATVTPSPIGSTARDLEPVQDLVVGSLFVNEAPGQRGASSAWTVEQVEFDLDEIEDTVPEDFVVFCGRSMNDFSNLRLIRTESVNGKSTRHYTGDIDADGDPNLVGCGPAP